MERLLNIAVLVQFSSVEIASEINLILDNLMLSTGAKFRFITYLKLNKYPEMLDIASIICLKLNE